MSDEIEKAEKALHELENNWLVIIDQLNQEKTRQMPKEEGNRIRTTCRDQMEQFYRFHFNELQDRDFGLEVINVNWKLFSHLDVALLEGKRRYENEKHLRSIEKINAWGVFLNNIKFNIGSLIVGIVGTYWYLLPKT